MSDDGPVYYYLYDRPAKKATLLFSNRPALEKYKLSSMKPIEYKARDGMTIYGYLTVPAGMESKAYRWCCSFTEDPGDATRGASTAMRSGWQIVATPCCK